MKRPFRGQETRFFAAVVLTTSVLLAPIYAAGAKTALHRYVAKPDSNYQYELVRTIKGEGVTSYVLSLTSQAWRSSKEVDRPIWKHWLTIVRPDTVKSNVGLLFINGGSNTSQTPPSSVDPRFVTIATVTQTVVADLRMVPNQPIVFLDDPEKKPRVEDDLIAYAMKKYLAGGDEEWVVRLPMTKSVVRAMDAVTDFLSKLPSNSLKVDRFAVAGGSKRGWTTWTTAVVDRRVIGIMPAVIDVLNNEASMRHHWRAYGFWAPAVKDYAEILTRELGSLKLREFARIEDPYHYIDQLTMPKFIVNAAGDEFFVPDSWQFYFYELKGEKYLRYVPNTGHSLQNSDAIESTIAFYQSLVDKKPRPRFTWSIGKDGAIRVKTIDKPSQVLLWAATNPEKRDFRLQSIGAAYKSQPLKPGANGEYVASVPKPEKGWTAYFVELTYPSGGRYPFKFTTGVRVVPDTLPFPDPKSRR